jgi:hypothetical protein
MIDYGLLQKSIDFYEKAGFKRIESPWLVSEAINKITAPEFVEQYYVTKGDKTKTFVASGEQSFLYLINKGFLPEGSYQTITPCMRNDVFDSWHTKYFLKNELIIFGKSASNKFAVDSIVDLAASFFKNQISKDHKDELEIVKTPDGFDIEFHGVELGSYGHRECDFAEWIYATGLAEPRFSKTMKRFDR